MSSSDDEIEQISFKQSKFIIESENLKTKQVLEERKAAKTRLQQRNFNQKQQAKALKDIQDLSPIDEPFEAPIVSRVKISEFETKIPFNKNLLQARRLKLGVAKRKTSIYKKFC